jgi:iron(III) transport system permease protein
VLLALFVLLLVRTLESFATPALLGLPAGITVLTSAIYDAVHRYPSEIGTASAYAAVLLLVAACGMALQSRLVRGGDRHATVTGHEGQVQRIDLGRWRLAVGALILLYLVVLVALPLAALLWTSLHRFYSPPSLAALDRLSLDAYRAVLRHPGVGGAVLNSILLAAASATAVMLLTAAVAWIVLRTRLPGRWLLDALATVPIAIPGIVLGLSLLVCYLAIGGALYGTLWILLVAYVTRFMPYGIRYSQAALLQIGRELEEAAAVSGAAWWATFRRVVLPLMRPGLLAGWLYVGVVSVRELSSSVLLYSPGSEVVAVVIWEMWQNGQIAELSALGVMLVAALLVVVAGAGALGIRVAARESG